LGGRIGGLTRTVVLEWRLPRVAAAVAFGAALGVAGAIFQTITRNPLASPDIIGLANGSFSGMLVALLLLGGRIGGLTRTVVLEWRLPRVAAAVAFGAALGVAGAIFQTIT
ncbi:iron chelate uptake ABC transporter family permease subunit, partial [Micromonospora sp. DH15]|nr:iron chelate uptake ABC transporter family permease subunit [Micromonospora sp. DH15]